MTPRLLQTFVSVARSGSMTRAASELNLAQSSVSDQIQTLEIDLGVSLFDRSTQGLALTPAGETLLPRAYEILDATHTARLATRAVIAGGELVLQIGALETIAADYLPRLIVALHAGQRDLAVRLHVAGTPALAQALFDNTSDAACWFRNGDLDKRLARKALAHVPLMLIGSPGAALPNDPVALERLPYVATESGCVYRHLFERIWYDAGRGPPAPVVEAGSMRGIVQLVSQGAGYAVVPSVAVKAAVAAKNVSAIILHGKAATLDIVWRRRRVLSPALRLLLDWLSNQSVSTIDMQDGAGRETIAHQEF